MLKQATMLFGFNYFPDWIKSARTFLLAVKLHALLISYLITPIKIFFNCFAVINPESTFCEIYSWKNGFNRNTRRKSDIVDSLTECDHEAYRSQSSR